MCWRFTVAACSAGSLSEGWDSRPVNSRTSLMGVTSSRKSSARASQPAPLAPILSPKLTAVRPQMV